MVSVWTPQVVGGHGSAIVDIHLDPEPQARARTGCWRTLSSYLRFLPSRVVRVVKLWVSLGTGTLMLLLCSMTGRWARRTASCVLMVSTTVMYQHWESRYRRRSDARRATTEV